MTGAGPACAIQPAGFLLALSEEGLIEAVSANIAAFVTCDPGKLIGRPASDVLAEDAIHGLRNRLALLRDSEGIERLLACRLTREERSFDVAVHLTEGRIIVEAEPATMRTFGDITGTLRGMYARLGHASDLDLFLAGAARQIRALTGFDRVMITRFDPDGSSAVIAEYTRSGASSLLGQRLSPDHLPPEERRCLLRSPLYLNADVEAELVPLMFGHEPEPLDLTRAILRPVTPAHRDRLREMDASAIMSIGLVVGGSLWGVILCLHQTARSPSFERRSIAELFAQLLALRIEIFELKKG
ncbi:MAG TPA: GAF domain-containing protein [Sphingomicrobium sp.]|nr:GAF domain-containing protein [Sphingomicrobium sp.]